MKNWEKYMHRELALSEMVIRDKWRKFARTGVCERMYCEHCPFDLKAQCGTNEDKMKWLNEEAVNECR